MPHIHEKIDFTADVFIVYKNKVLLRMHDKYNVWLAVGGHIELDEDPIEAAYREVKEEVGLEVKIVGEASGPQSGEEDNRQHKYLIPPRFMGRHPVSPTHEHISMVYFATSVTDKVVDSMSEHERTESRFVTREELATMDLIPNIKFYAEQALEALGTK